MDGVRIGGPGGVQRGPLPYGRLAGRRAAERRRQQAGHLAETVEGPLAALHPRLGLLQAQPGGLAAGLRSPGLTREALDLAGRAGAVGLGRPHPAAGVVELGLHPAYVGAERVEQRGVLGLRGGGGARCLVSVGAGGRRRRQVVRG